MNRYAMLRIRDIFVLPIVKEKSERKTFFYTEQRGKPSSRSAIETIKERVSIADYLEARGFSLESYNGGLSYSMRCPFHNDHQPSFWVMADKRVCGCHRCDFKPMDVINLHMRLTDCDTRQAIRDLL